MNKENTEFFEQTEDGFRQYTIKPKADFVIS